MSAIRSSALISIMLSISDHLSRFVISPSVRKVNFFLSTSMSPPQYEIRTNPQVVDLLVSLAYVSAREHQLSDSLPVGLGLRVPLPKELPPPIYLSYLVRRSVAVEANQKSTVPPVGSDGLCDFDDLPLPLVSAAVLFAKTAFF